MLIIQLFLSVRDRGDIGISTLFRCDVSTIISISDKYFSLHNCNGNGQYNIEDMTASYTQLDDLCNCRPR